MTEAGEIRRVAVTGGAGRLGRYVVAELAAHGDLLVVDQQHPERLPDCEFRQADVTDLQALRHAFAGVDAVIHLAGIDLDFPRGPEDFIQVNAMGTWNVLQAARECGARRVVLCSSVMASGLPEMREDHAPAYLPIDEDHPDRPGHPYGLSKQLAEMMAGSVRIGGPMQVLCLRPMMVSLPENIPILQAKAADPTTRWTFSHIGPEDCARAFRCALFATGVRDSIFYITAPDSCICEPTLGFAERVFGRLPALRRPDVYAANPRASLFDGSRAREQLGFEPAQAWSQLTSDR